MYPWKPQTYLQFKVFRCEGLACVNLHLSMLWSVVVMKLLNFRPLFLIWTELYHFKGNGLGLNSKLQKIIRNELSVYPSYTPITWVGATYAFLSVCLYNRVQSISFLQKSKHLKFMFTQIAYEGAKFVFGLHLSIEKHFKIPYDLRVRHDFYPGSFG